MSSRHLQHFFKTSSKILQDFFKIYYQVRLFLFNVSSGHVQGVFKTYCKSDYLQKVLPRPHVLEFYGQGTNFPRVNSLDVSKVLVKCFQNALWSFIADGATGLNIPFWLTKVTEMEFLEKNKTTGTNLSVLHFDQNFRQNFEILSNIWSRSSQQMQGLKLTMNNINNYCCD